MVTHAWVKLLYGREPLTAGLQWSFRMIQAVVEQPCRDDVLEKPLTGSIIRFHIGFVNHLIDTIIEENLLPFDQHTLLSLIAPRPLYVASAVDDQWADPRGEFLAASYASPAYSLYNYNGLDDAEMPDVDKPLFSDQVAYHIRSGGHDLTLYDWQQFVHFADQQFASK